MCRPTKACPKCRRWKKMTNHHVYPRRHFGKVRNNLVFNLCQDCHSDLEMLIPAERIPREKYPEILLSFLADTTRALL